MTASTVVVEREDGVVTITLNRPERRNGVTIEMCEALFRREAPG